MSQTWNRLEGIIISVVFFFLTTLNTASGWCKAPDNHQPSVTQFGQMAEGERNSGPSSKHKTPKSSQTESSDTHLDLASKYFSHCPILLELMENRTHLCPWRCLLSSYVTNAPILGFETQTIIYACLGTRKIYVCHIKATKWETQVSIKTDVQKHLREVRGFLLTELEESHRLSAVLSKFPQLIHTPFNIPIR